jgi:hypothetical protein
MTLLNILRQFRVYFMAIWYSLWSFGIFFHVLVCLDPEKSGNPGVGVYSAPIFTFSVQCQRYYLGPHVVICVNK